MQCACQEKDRGFPETGNRDKIQLRFCQQHENNHTMGVSIGNVILPYQQRAGCEVFSPDQQLESGIVTFSGQQAGGGGVSFPIQHCGGANLTFPGRQG